MQEALRHLYCPLKIRTSKVYIMKRIIFEWSVGSDGGFQIYLNGQNIRIDCNYLFDRATGDRTEIYINFDKQEYEKSMALLQTNGAVHLENNSGDFLDMEVADESKIHIHFGRVGGIQHSETIKAITDNFLLD